MELFENFNISDLYIIIFFISLLGVLILTIYNNIKINSLSKKYNSFIKSFGDADIETSLKGFMKRVEEVYSKGLELENHCNQLDRSLMKCIQKSGVIRYSAFEDVGCDLSFAIALLDANDDGFVINGIYARDSSSTYAKPIANAKSKYTLSAEEMQAIDIAKRFSRKDS